MTQVTSKKSGPWIWKSAERFVGQRPWQAAFLLTPLTFAVLVMIFRPAYETNDDAAISMIAAGKLIAAAPDEHLVFTHPAIGLMLKELYTRAPNLPWYGLYLLATQAVAHVVITGLLFLYCPPRRALAWFAFWMMTTGVYFITRLQFTTTAFLAGMAGVLLLWEAARRVVDRPHGAPSDVAVKPILGLLICGAALIFWCEMIRWYMFYLILMLPLPVVGAWWLLRRPGWKLTTQAAFVLGLVAAGGLALKEAHLAYYHNDPEWHDFYEYNALRAQFNDTVKIVYNDETRNSFEQVGWSAIDMQMITSWCYDDPTIFSHDKLRQIWESRVWNPSEQKPIQLIAADWLTFLLERPMRLSLFLLGTLTFLVPLDRRNLFFYSIAVGTALGTILMLSVFQKIPPARVYMPIMIWTIAALGWNLLSQPSRGDAAPALWQVLPNLFASCFRPGTRVYPWARTGALLAPKTALLLGLGMIVVENGLYQAQHSAAQQKLQFELESMKPQPSKLYVLWGASLPVEDLMPLHNYAVLDDLKMLWLGWPQQMQTHREMKARYGITNLLRELPDHPEAVVICPQICTEFYATYVKTHYASDIRAVPAGNLMGNPIFQIQRADEDVVAEKPRGALRVE